LNSRLNSLSNKTKRLLLQEKELVQKLRMKKKKNLRENFPSVQKKEGGVQVLNLDR